MSVEDRYRALRNNLEAVRELVTVDLQPYILDGVPNSKEDVIARQIRKGLAISSFNDFESFVVDVAGDLAEQINRLQLETHDLPEDEKMELASSVWESEKKYSKRRKAETVATRRAQAAESFFSLTRNGPLYLSPLYGMEGSNLSFAEIGQTFKQHLDVLRLVLALEGIVLNSRFSFNTCSTFLFNESKGPVKLLVKNVSDYFDRVAQLRHKCAHEADFKPDIGQLKSFISGLIFFMDSVAIYAKSIESGLNHYSVEGFGAVTVAIDHSFGLEDPRTYRVNFVDNLWDMC